MSRTGKYLWLSPAQADRQRQTSPSEIRLSIALMHVPDDPYRRLYLQQIERALGGLDGIHAGTVKFSVIRDVQRKGVWWTAKQAWAAYPPWATHHLVLQDDMLPCSGFFEKLYGALAARPAHCVCLFSMRKILDAARELGHSWTVSDEGCWGGSCVLPVSWIDEYLEWVRLHIPADYLHDDRRLMHWLLAKRYLVWQTAPCLLQHIGAAHSTIGFSNKNRVARWYADETPEHVIDWQAGLSSPLYEHKYSFPDSSIVRQDEWR